MIVKIQPVQVFSPGKGLITAVQADISVARYELGKTAVGTYQLQQVDPTDPNKERVLVINGSQGQSALTPEQFASWGPDDGYFARCILENVGLKPA